MATPLTTLTPASYTLIFWGNSYDENATTIFTTGLRAAGLRVKIVGTSGIQAKGQSGITLQADLCANEIYSLAKETRCIVLPCDLLGYRQLEKDPQLNTFFTELRNSLNRSSRDVTFVLHQSLKSISYALQESVESVEVLIYPQEEALFAFTRTMVERIKGRFQCTEKDHHAVPRHLFPTHLQGFVYP